MARRRSGVLEDVVEIMSKLPWWVGIVVAIISYLFFNYLASSSVETNPENIKNLGESVKSQIIVIFSSIAQYAIPLAALIGSMVSAFKSSKQSTPSKNQTYSRHKPSINSQTAENVNCPVCSSPMVKRKSRKGALVGQEFWGCSNYPSCKGTRQI